MSQVEQGTPEKESPADMEVDDVELSPTEAAAARPPPRIESQNSPGSLTTPSPGVEELIAVAGTNTERNTKRAVGKRRRKTNESVLPTENNEEGASQPCQKKRILPPRKVGTLASVLAEEVAAEQENKEPTVTGETYLLLTSDESIIQTCDVVEEEVNIGEDVSMKNGDNKTEIPVPSFKLWDEDVGSGLRSKAQEEETSDAAYEKRHRKHELAEKKLKNRERERLAYERYQQQLAVEKLRNTDSKSLISVAALRNNDVTNDASKLETVHKKLLKEAEDTLARYDSLGLGGKKRKTDVSSNNTEGESKVTEEPECKKVRLRGSRRTSNANSDDIPSRTKVETPVRVTRSRKKNEKQLIENNVKTIAVKRPTKSSPRTRKTQKPTISPIDLPPPSPIAHQRVMTFIKPNTAMPSGLRKSSRSALAFGHRISTKSLAKRDFVLPMQIFGGMMRDRENLRSIEYQQQIDAAKEYDALMEKSTK